MRHNHFLTNSDLVVKCVTKVGYITSKPHFSVMGSALGADERVTRVSFDMYKTNHIVQTPCVAVVYRTGFGPLLSF